MGQSIGVVGLGLVGGSFAKALRDQYELFVWDQDQATRRMALEEGYALLEPELLADRCQTVFLALPVLATSAVAKALLDNDAQLVVSMASAQEAIFSDVESDSRYWGAHPLAGGTAAGWEASRADLLQGAPWALASRSGSLEHFFVIMEILNNFDSSIVPVLPEEHDKALALTSHTVQVIHSALAAMLADQSPLVHRLSGPALRDTTRLAESSLSMWQDILAANDENISSALDQFGQEIASAKDSLDDPRLLWRHAAYGRESLFQYRWTEDQWTTRSVPLQHWWQGLLEVGRKGGAVRDPRQIGPLLYFQSSV